MVEQEQELIHTYSVILRFFFIIPPVDILSTANGELGMVFNTITVGAAVTPAVIETYFSHVSRLDL